ncbi:acyltransferase [Microbispora sp. H10836]|uniref:acyltransferase family protein n=1 Tax=Microbispora sp. H10836 TaxID=2729106 RepID=UPI001473EB68|nr:acyltransferase [Microbispora sp. H10836]
MVATSSAHGARADSGERIPRLEGVRGVLALGVLVFHAAWLAGATSFMDQPGNGIWGYLADGLAVCLPPFFVLSGLFLYRPFARAVLAGTRRPNVPAFLTRRAFRILPAYWLMLAVALLFINLNGIHGIRDVIRPFLAIHFFWQEGQPLTGLLHTWTVPTELTFYLAIPLLALASNRLARRSADPARRMRLMMITPALVLAGGFAWIVYTNLPSFKGPYEFWFWPFYYMTAFACGMALGILHAYSEVTGRVPGLYRLAARRPNLFWLAALVVYLAYAPQPFGTPGMGDWPALIQELVGHTLVLVFGVLFIVPLTLPEAKSRFIDAVLANPVMRYLGRISYGIYLWHVLVQEFYLKNGNIFGVDPLDATQFRGTVGFWETTAFVLAVSVVLSTVSYYALERPVMKLWNVWFRKDTRARVTAADPAQPGVPVGAASTGSDRA